jgi:hypothetical protein
VNPSNTGGLDRRITSRPWVPTPVLPNVFFFLNQIYDIIDLCTIKKRESTANSAGPQCLLTLYFILTKFFLSLRHVFISCICEIRRKWHWLQHFKNFFTVRTQLWWIVFWLSVDLAPEFMSLMVLLSSGQEVRSVFISVVVGIFFFPGSFDWCCSLDFTRRCQWGLVSSRTQMVLKCHDSGCPGTSPGIAV